jgi:hypothetical protein
MNYFHVYHFDFPLSASLSTQDYETYQFYSDDDQFYTGEAEDDFPFIMDEEVKIDAGDADADDDDDDDPPIDEEGNKEYWPVVGVITWRNLLLMQCYFTVLCANYYVYKACHNCTNIMFLLYRFVLCKYSLQFQI